MVETWRTRGASGRDYTLEQDQAAGGRIRRRVETPDDKPTHASVVLKKPANRIYAYLRYSYGGRTWTRYVGDVSSAQDRAEALRMAWRIVRRRKDLVRHERSLGAGPRDPAVTSRIMAAVRGVDTGPEIALRRELHRRNLRFRKNYSGLIGRPDIVFPGPRVVVFVDGDFWHGRSWKARGYANFEEQFGHRNADFWRTKLLRNVERDREVNATLRKAGWKVVRILASDVLRNVTKAANRVEGQVRGDLA